MSGQEDREAGQAAGADAVATAAIGPFERVRAALTGQPQLTLDDVSDQAGVPLQVLREVFAATEWSEQPGYDERDVAYARAMARVLDVFPLRSVVRMLRTRYRAMTSIVVSDLDAAMLVGSDITRLAGALINLCESRSRLAEAPRRGGLACGEVLVRDGDYYGPVPNLAARLSDHARPWSVLADDTLADQLAASFDVETIPKTELPGIGQRRPLRVRAPEHAGPDDG